nr:reverse transcriptase domain-containing protein [Tanacetum cinerariifolium]
MDDEPMWVADRVVAPTLGFVITIPETANEFAIKALFDRLLKEICAFSKLENESLTDGWLRMKEMLQNCHGHNLSKGNIIKIFYHGLSKITREVLNATAGGIFLYKTPNQAYQLPEDKVLLKLDLAKNQKTKSSLKKTIAFTDEAKNMLVEVGKFTFLTNFVILEIKEDSKVPLILGRPFLHTADAVIRVKYKQLNLGVGTERMISMVADENSESKSDTEELPFEKIAINTDYKIKTSLKEPHMDLKLKPLSDNLEYVFLEEPSFLPVIISSQLFAKNKSKLISILKNIKKPSLGKRQTFL